MQVYAICFCSKTMRILYSKKKIRGYFFRNRLIDGGNEAAAEIYPQGTNLHGADKWGFPGGEMQRNYKYMLEEACREFCEETGVDIRCFSPSFYVDIFIDNEGFAGVCMDMPDEILEKIYKSVDESLKKRNGLLSLFLKRPELKLDKSNKVISWRGERVGSLAETKVVDDELNLVKLETLEQCIADFEERGQKVHDTEWYRKILYRMNFAYTDSDFMGRYK